MLHSIESNWDTRTLQRNIKTQYLSRVLELPKEKLSAQQFIKDPYLFEFLNLPNDTKQTENNIETAPLSLNFRKALRIGK